MTCNTATILWTCGKEIHYIKGATTNQLQYHDDHFFWPYKELFADTSLNNYDEHFPRDVGMMMPKTAATRHRNAGA